MRHSIAFAVGLMLTGIIVAGCLVQPAPQSQASTTELQLHPKQALVFDFGLVFSSGKHPGNTPYTVVCRLAADVGADRQTYNMFVEREREFVTIAESILDDREVLEGPAGHEAVFDSMRYRFNGALGASNAVRAVYAYDFQKVTKP